MGDMADYIIEQGYDAMLWGEDCDEPVFERLEGTRNIRCKVCGRDGFHFKKTESGKWWLATATGKWHTHKKKEQKKLRITVKDLPF